MVECVLSQLKPAEFSILSCEKCLDLRPRTFFTAKNAHCRDIGPSTSPFFLICRN